MYLNKAFLYGNLTRDPELKALPSGQNLVSFGLATNRAWVTRDHQKHQSSEFHELVAWGKLAEICSQYLKKGKLVFVEGYLKTRSWDNQDGTKKFRTEVVVNDMIMLEKRNKDGQHEMISMSPEDEEMVMEEYDMSPEDATTREESEANEAR